MTLRLARLFSVLGLSVALPLHAHTLSGDSKGVALDPGLSALHHPVSTRNPKAQAYFDQGLRLIYAFNHEAAVQSFEQAADLDPDLAMAYWGIALALGPNYNAPMSKEDHARAYAALAKAVARKPYASMAERAYIDALAKRYSANPEADVGPLLATYKDAMADLSRRYPNDLDARVLYAESLMNLHPWKLWAPDGTPNEGTMETVAVLEGVLARKPDHIGAIHYYIHAVEASPQPGKALPAARRLDKLAPSAGHLVHMPSHTYIRTGRYLEAARVNEAAARADEKRVADGEQTMYLLGYYSHNLHFLAISSAIAGDSARALAAANKLAKHVGPKARELPMLDGFLFTPTLVLVRFGRWDEILGLPEPEFETPVTASLWRFARALAFAEKGQLAQAQTERDKFVESARSVPRTLDFGNNSAAALMAIAVPYLDGRLALQAGNAAGAISNLWLAVGAEDALAYDEPPAWFLPAREALGVALLQAGDLPAAEQVFRDALAQNPESGRALFGLQTALARQGRAQDAAAAQKRFERAWRGADVILVTASLEERRR